MTNREAHEEAAGMGLEGSFFAMNNIDPDAEYIDLEEKMGWLRLSEDSLKENWFCGKCSLKHPTAFQFCPFCGCAQIKESATAKVKPCPDCVDGYSDIYRGPDYGYKCETCRGTGLK